MTEEPREEVQEETRGSWVKARPKLEFHWGWLAVFAVVLVLAAIVFSSRLIGSEPTPTATQTPTQTQTPKPKPTQTPTPTPTPMVDLAVTVTALQTTVAECCAETPVVSTTTTVSGTLRMPTATTMWTATRVATTTATVAPTCTTVPSTTAVTGCFFDLRETLRGIPDVTIENDPGAVKWDGKTNGMISAINVKQGSATANFEWWGPPGEWNQLIEEKKVEFEFGEYNLQQLYFEGDRDLNDTLQTVELALDSCSTLFEHDKLDPDFPGITIHLVCPADP